MKALAGIIGQRERQVITAVVDDVRAINEGTASQMMPVVNRPAAVLLHQKVSAFGGMTGERSLDSQGKSIPASSRKSKYFAPGSYQESIRFNERDLLMYAKLGTLGDRGVTGLNGDQLNEMEMSAKKLRARIENRISKLTYDAFYTGKYTYQGVEFDFEVPAANTITATTDWTNPTLAKPFDDLWKIVKLNSNVLKYKIKEIRVNPKTMTDMMLSQQTKDVLKNYNLTSADVNKVAQLVVPGLPPIVEVKDVYQEETYGAEGEVILGNAQFFVPNDRCHLVPDFGQQIFQTFGEFQIAENMNAPEATPQKPAQGIYLFVDEKGLENRKNPHVEIVAGFNGAPNLMRSDDVIMVKTTP